MNQRDLFGEPGLQPAQQVIAAEKREQAAQLGRVHKDIAARIVSFLEERGRSPEPLFRMEELRQYVALRSQIAPGSADRILRLLRQDGHVNYRVVNRAESLYEVLP